MPASPLNLPPLPVPTVLTEAVAIPDAKGKTVTELAKEMAPESIIELYRIGTNPEEKGSTRVAALSAIIDRAEGKVGIVESPTINYNTVITQINRVYNSDPLLTDVTPGNASS